MRRQKSLGAMVRNADEIDIDFIDASGDDDDGDGALQMTNIDMGDEGEGAKAGDAELLGREPLLTVAFDLNGVLVSLARHTFKHLPYSSIHMNSNIVCLCQFINTRFQQSESRRIDRADSGAPSVGRRGDEEEPPPARPAPPGVSAGQRAGESAAPLPLRERRFFNCCFVDGCPFKITPRSTYDIPLISQIRLGIFTSATERTARGAIQRIEQVINQHPSVRARNTFTRPFDFLLHREHCRPASADHIARGGNEWDTVKPLGGNFSDVSRIVLVDDDLHKVRAAS